MATGLDLLQKNIPDQYIDVGIAEQHAVTLAAGMSCDGLKPCLLYTSPSPRDREKSRMPSSA